MGRKIAKACWLSEFVTSIGRYKLEACDLKFVAILV